MNNHKQNSNQNDSNQNGFRHKNRTGSEGAPQVDRLRKNSADQDTRNNKRTKH